MKRFRISLITASCTAAALAGCAGSPNAPIATLSRPVLASAAVVAQATPVESFKVNPATPGSAMAADAAAAAAINKPISRHATRAWHSSRMSDVQDDEVLPPIFSETFKFDFDDRLRGGRVSIAVAAERISRLSGVVVRVKTDVYAGSGSPSGQPAQAIPVANPFPMPAGVPVPAGGAGVRPAAPLPSSAPGSISAATAPAGVPGYNQPITDVASIEMRWNGTLAGFLDHVTSRLGLSWSYRNGSIVIERYITEVFEMASFGGTQDYKMSLSGGNSGQSGAGNSTGSANSSLNLSEDGKLAILESLRQAVSTMVAPAGGSVVLNEGTGRFFVSAPKDVMNRVREVIKAEDGSLQRQAMIQFDIYSVTTNDARESGVDWSIVSRSLNTVLNTTFKSPASLTGATAGGLGVSILAGVAGSTESARYGDSRAVLNLLNQVGTNALYRPVSLVALNRQWARKTNLKTDGYVSETTPSTSSSAGSGAPGLKTASVTTGDKIMVQPAILDNGSIVLRFGVSLSELLGLFDVTAGAGASLQKVQTPVTSGTDDQGTVRLQPGEAMVVTGLSRRVASNDVRSLGESVPTAFGGSRKEAYKREDFLIIVRAVQF